MSEKISNRKGLKISLMVLSGLLVLAIIIMPFLDKKLGSTIRPEMKDFAVEKPDEVDKIFMASKSGATLTLSKNEEGIWMVNNSFPAEEAKVKMLLYEYMARLKVRNPIPNDGVERVRKELAATGTKVEVYSEDKKIKTYYVGGNTADELGTFMYMEGSSVPFAVHIPGFVGYVSSVYNLREQDWRSTNIFNTSIIDLASVEVIYPGDMNSSFKINKIDRRLELRGADTTAKAEGELKEEFLKQYAATFEHLHFEAYFDRLAKDLADSVVNAAKTPYATIIVVNNNGNSNKLDLYQKPVTKETKQQFSESGIPLEFDQDRFYGVINDKKDEIVSVQNYVFKNVLKKIEDFYETGSREDRRLLE